MQSQLATVPPLSFLIPKRLHQRSLTSGVVVPGPALRYTGGFGCYGELGFWMCVLCLLQRWADGRLLSAKLFTSPRCGRWKLRYYLLGELRGAMAETIESVHLSLSVQSA